MPNYDYECEKCGKTFEAFQSMKDKTFETCPESSCLMETWGKGKEAEKAMMEKIKEAEKAEAAAKAPAETPAGEASGDAAAAADDVDDYDYPSDGKEEL